jgi:GNAT superfamily N-acetyltransferase
MMDLIIRQPSESDMSEWVELWTSYLVFYESEVPDPVTKHLWSRILDPDNGIRCHVAESDGRLVGLVHFFCHDDTWSTRPICYLQDLYVDASHRGQGIGAELVGSVVAEARAEGWSGVYWLTAEDNHQARILYDRLTGGTSGFIHYEIDVASS